MSVLDKKSPINAENITILNMHRRRIAPHIYDKSPSTDSPLDYPGVAALIFGIGALYLHSKASAYLCLVSAFSSWNTVRKEDRDWKSIITMWMFGIIGLVVNYFVNWDGKY